MATGRSRPGEGAAAILASDWYAQMIGAPLEPAQEALADAYPAPLVQLAGRVSPLRGLLLFGLADRARGLALTAGEPGFTTLLLGEAWLRRRRARIRLEVVKRRQHRPLRTHN